TRWPSESPPSALPAHDVTFPPYELRTLENGLQVVAVLHHEQPVVSMRMIVRAGSADDPPGKAGLAHLAALLLDQGTETRSAREVNEQIDFIGGAMDAGAGVDLTFLNVIVMKDSFDVGLRMLSDMARHPAFAPEEIERQRQQVLSHQQVNLNDPAFVASAVFDRLVFGVHPYGMPQAGTPQTMRSLTREDLQTYHARNFVPNNAILAIVGDVTADEAFEGVRAVFGDWPRREIARPSFVKPPEPERRVVVINKPDAVQTEIRVGHLGVTRTNADYMALDMTLRVLGGDGDNRLHQVLRSEHGLTYGAKAKMVTLVESGDFEASTSTRSDATGEALRLIVDEIWRLQRERVGPRELADAKAYVTGNFPLTIETPDAIATQVLNMLVYGLPIEYLKTFRDRVNAVTADDIERVARVYLRPDRLSIVLVGNAAAFTTQLRRLGFSNVETLEMSDLDLMSPSLKRQPGTASVRPAAAVPDVATPVRVAYQPSAAQSAQRPPASSASADARDVLREAIAAKGGLDRLRSVARIKATTRATSIGPTGQRETVETITYLEYPEKVRVESVDPRLQMLQIFDGQHAWVKDPDGVHDVPEEMMRDLKASVRRDTIALLLAANDGRVNARLLPDVKEASGRTLRALEFSSTTLDPIVLYLDAATHLVVKQAYVSGGMGAPLIEELFEDYRPVNGINVAYKTSVHVGGRPLLDRLVTDITIDGAPFPPALFTRPPA
ncbi:MAG: insulinase family protein, partial [Acidobacteriaceae bacterium]|nr:insulinase family protein [Acidobacteriaceae bacterium]